jgi:hypothetical protein
MKNAASEGTRIRVAYALKRFPEESAKVGAQLRQDVHHRVVGATMEDLIS